jgi:hypothetical protein
MAGERHGKGMACVNQTRPHCVNQMGNTQSKALAERHDRGTAEEWQGDGRKTAWERHGMCESALRLVRYLDREMRYSGPSAASSGNFLRTFWDEQSVPSSRFMNPCWMLDR